MEKRQAKLKHFQFNSSKCAINSMCSQNFDTEMCVTYPWNALHWKKLTLKVKMVAEMRNVYPILSMKFECFFYYLQCTKH
jgi:hypothetical protein